VKSTVVMKENLEQMEHRGMKIPVVLGGAALTKRYVEQDLRKVYNGYVSYAGDAFDGLHFMEKVKGGVFEKPDGAGVNTAANLTTSSTALDKSLELNRARVATRDKGAEGRSKVRTDVAVPVPPFYGSIAVSNIKLEKIWEYLNDVALIRGQWQFRKKGRSDEEYKRMLEADVYPTLEELKLKVKRERIFEPKIVYGYFPCASEGNDLIIYRPANEPDLYSKWNALVPDDPDKSGLVEWLRFQFPRQSDDRFLCISDFFRSVESGKLDVVAFQAVTVGAGASENNKQLFDSGQYQDYLYMHGLSVESAEALAEYWHKIVRTELGIQTIDSPDTKKLFSQGYQGSRYSFGYPACPDLADQAKLFELLRPERIGLSLTEEMQLVPEQSTTALVVHHPGAKYFNIK